MKISRYAYDDDLNLAEAFRKLESLKYSHKAMTSFAKSSPYSKTREDIKRHLISRCRYRAKKKGLPFSITTRDITYPTVCPVLGVPLDGRDRDHFPSIDRVKPELGYVKGNVNVISQRANRIKSDATKVEIFKIYRYMVEHERSQKKE